MSSTLVPISIEDLDFLKEAQREILEEMKGMKKSTVSIRSVNSYLTVNEFMGSLEKCRFEFNNLGSG